VRSERRQPTPRDLATSPARESPIRRLSYEMMSRLVYKLVSMGSSVALKLFNFPTI
jgi:hypothetical protein